MKTLLIDNYDSFTYNLFQLLAEVNGDEPIGRAQRRGRLGRAPGSLEFDNIVDLAGPRAARHERRLRRLRGRDPATPSVPLLGVCLGHQGLGWVTRRARSCTRPR